MINVLGDLTQDVVSNLFSMLLGGFFEDLANDAVDFLNDLLVDLIDVSLNSQEYMTGHLGLTGINFDQINSVVLKFALGCIVLKFVQKGFNIYILQMDGDAEHDPFTLLTGFCEAIAISITFITLYPYIIGIFKSFAREILGAVGSRGEIQTIEVSIVSSMFGKGITTTISVIVFIVVAIILYITLIINGAEILVLKYAMPFCSVGLMDSDGGTFKTAGKKILQTGFTAVLKIVLFRLAVALLLTMHPIWAIAFGILAITTPKLLQEFLYIRQGGGMTSKLYAMSALRGFMR